jgi:hypothetical protein
MGGGLGHGCGRGRGNGRGIGRVTWGTREREGLCGMMERAAACAGGCLAHLCDFCIRANFTTCDIAATGVTSATGVTKCRMSCNL